MTTKPVSRFKAATTLTLSGGAISIVQGVHVVAAEAGTTDDLDTINNGVFNMELFLMADSGDTITIKDGTGNIETGDGNDIDLDGDKVAHLLYDVANTVWKVVAVSATGGGGSGTSTSNVIDSQTASNSATLSFDVSGQTGAVQFILEGIVPATDGADLTIEVSDDNGSTWESTSYQWANGYEESDNDPAAYGGNTSTTTGNTDAIYITGSIGSASGEGAIGKVQMDNPANTSLYKNFLWETGYLAAGGQSVKATGSGMWKGSTNAITNVRFLFDSGNIESGTIKMIDPAIAQSGAPSLFEDSEVRIPGEWWQDPNNTSDYYPKYRKVVDLGSLPDSTTKNVAHGLSNVHWDSLTISGNAFNSGSSYVQPINTPDPSSNASAISCVLAGTTNLEVETGIDRTSYVGMAILEYAKTTDTAVTRDQAYGNGSTGTTESYNQYSSNTTLTRQLKQYVGLLPTTAAAAFQIDLPASPNTSDEVWIKDEESDASTYNITLSGNGNNIDGSGTYTVNQDGEALVLKYVFSEWRVF